MALPAGAGGFEGQGEGQPEFMGWRQSYQISEFYGLYCFYCRRLSVPRPVPISIFGKRLNQLLPSITKTRISEGRVRRNVYLLLELEHARDEFTKENQLGALNWPEEESLFRNAS